MILSESAINIYQRFFDAVFNTVYHLSFTHLFVLDLLKVHLITKILGTIKVSLIRL